MLFPVDDSKVSDFSKRLEQELSEEASKKSVKYNFDFFNDKPAFLTIAKQASTTATVPKSTVLDSLLSGKEPVTIGNFMWESLVEPTVDPAS